MVSIHIVPVIVSLIIKVISSTFRFKGGCATERIHLFLCYFKNNGPSNPNGNPANTQMVIMTIHTSKKKIV